MSNEMNNPLAIDVVLNGIFEYLKVEDLKICRAVCSLWNLSVLSSSSWKRGAKVRVRTDAQIGDTMETFLKFAENGKCFSQIYSIEAVNIPLDFWSICGTWIKLLRLQSVTFESKDDFRTIVYNSCPNMEQLSLFHIFIRKSEHDQMEELEPNECTEIRPRFGERRNMKYLAVTPFRESEATLWIELLCHFPNLQALQLNSGDHSLSRFFHLLSEFPQKFPSKFNLKHVSIQSRTNPYPGFFQILKDPALKLQTISTKLCCEPEDFREILSKHASSLKKLTLEWLETHNRKIDPHQIFPLQSVLFQNVGLDVLQVLEVHDQLFLSMAILKFTPNLRVFKVTGNDQGAIENTKESEMRGVSLVKCKRLSVYFNVISLESLRKLVTWLPNVEELELLRLSNAQFQMICESWPGLVRLCADLGTVDEMGITGLDEEDVRRINHNGESSDWRPITVPRANISALKELRSLYIQSATYREMGYCAAIRGFDLLPKLQQLTLSFWNLKGCICKHLQSRFPDADYPFRKLQDLSCPFYS